MASFATNYYGTQAEKGIYSIDGKIIGELNICDFGAAKVSGYSHSGSIAYVACGSSIAFLPSP